MGLLRCWLWKTAPLIALFFFVILFVAQFMATKSENPPSSVVMREEELASYGEKASSNSSSPIKELSVLFPSARGRDLISLPPPQKSGRTSVVALYNGTIYLLDSNSVIHGFFSSGQPLSTSYYSTTEDCSSYVFCADNGKLYEYNKDFGIKWLEITIDEYVNMTPFTPIGGGFILGSKKSTEFAFDAKTGEVVTSCWTDVCKADGGFVDMNYKPMVRNLQTQNHSNAFEDDVEIVYVTRKDYALNCYTSLRKLSWNMTVSCIEAYSCAQPNCTKLDVKYIYDPSPKPRAHHHKHFQRPPLPSSLHGMLALDAPTDTIPSHFTKQESVDAKAVSIASNQASVMESLKVAFGSFTWYHILFVLLCLLLLYELVRNWIRSDKQSNDLVKKQNGVVKKRKVRKGTIENNTTIRKSNSHSSFSNNDEVVSAELRNVVDRKGKEVMSNILGGKGQSGGDGRRVGKLFISNTEIAKGSNGTVIFEGIYDGRQVAVKRLVSSHHDVASKEIQNLIASDQHPNIVRWFGVESDVDFVYLALERCACSMNDLIEYYSDSNELSITAKNFDVDVELWKENGCPSFQMLKLMRDIIIGVAHLHDLGIIHRDLKPQNVLINSHSSLSAKLSDMGISKRLPEQMSSLGHHATGHGSSGWQAPEQLLNGRQTRAVDLFSIGCVFFFCMTKGGHPFGNKFERDSNIINNCVDLFLVEHIPEAIHLFSNLLNPDPELRLTAVQVLQHPLLWDSEHRLSFLRDASDRIEVEDKNSELKLLNSIEKIAPIAFGGRWGDKLDALLLTDMGRYRKYRFESTRDLLRVIRNKLNHYRQLSNELQEILGSVPEGFDDYFRRRFPKLFLEVYLVIYRYCREDDLFNKYFKTGL